MANPADEARLFAALREECRRLGYGELHVILKVEQGHAFLAKVEQRYRTLTGHPENLLDNPEAKSVGLP